VNTATATAPSRTNRDLFPEALFTNHPNSPAKPVVLNDARLVGDLFAAADGIMPERSRQWLEGWMELVTSDGRPEIANTVAAYALAGWLSENAYRREMYQPSSDDPEFKLKNDCLDGLDEFVALTSPFAPPSYFYHEIAVRVAREEPQIERSMAKLNDRLPFAWQIVDAWIHASGKVTELHLLALSAIWKASGHVPTHACSCSSRTASLGGHGGVINFDVAAIVHDKPGESSADRAIAVQDRLAYLIQHAGFSHAVCELMALFMGFPTGVAHSPQGQDARANGLFTRLFTLNPADALA
jgi:hypothetical protein